MVSVVQAIVHQYADQVQQRDTVWGIVGIGKQLDECGSACRQKRMKPWWLIVAETAQFDCPLDRRPDSTGALVTAGGGLWPCVTNLPLTSLPVCFQHWQIPFACRGKHIGRFTLLGNGALGDMPLTYTSSFRTVH